MRKVYRSQNFNNLTKKLQSMYPSEKYNVTPMLNVKRILVERKDGTASHNFQIVTDGGKETKDGLFGSPTYVLDMRTPHEVWIDITKKAVEEMVSDKFQIYIHTKF